MGVAIDLQSWIGRRETVGDTAALAPLLGLQAVLDRDLGLAEGANAPLLGHWLYFLPHAPQSMLSTDGHPMRGGFMPPVALPRRMWAGGRIDFHRPIAIGAKIERRSTITDVQMKSGASGNLVFVTVEHRVFDGEILLIEERQDIVYRDAAKPAEGPGRREDPQAPPPSDCRREVEATPALLFRYSALTFNAHRIHYDRNYAVDAEFYPGLVVQGPLLATLLMDFFRRERPDARIRSFEFKSRRPLFDGQAIQLHLKDGESGASLWACDGSGQAATSASVSVS